MGSILGASKVIGSLLMGGGFSLISNVVEMIGRERDKARLQTDKAAERQHELALIEMNEKVRRAEAETERETAIVAAQGVALQAALSHQTASQQRAAPWVSSVLSLVRPALTFGLAGGTVYVVVAGNDPAQAATATAAMIDLAGVAVGFWFSDRVFAGARRATRA